MKREISNQNFCSRAIVLLYLTYDESSSTSRLTLVESTQQRHSATAIMVWIEADMLKF